MGKRIRTFAKITTVCLNAGSPDGLFKLESVIAYIVAYQDIHL